MQDDIRDFRHNVNLLIALGVAALLFSALLSAYIVLTDLSRLFLGASWFVFIVSIVFGIFVRKNLLQLDTAGAEIDGEVFCRDVHLTYFIQMSGFVFGVIFLAICSLWPLLTQITKSL